MNRTHYPTRQLGNWGRALVAITLALSLSYCAQVPTAPSQVDFKQQLPRLQQLSDWQLEGKLGIKLPDDNGSARLSWQQQGEAFYLTLSGPLGSGRVVIEGNEQFASLQQADQPPLQAESADALLFHATGWQLPVELLRYWVRGIPAPALAASAQVFDDTGALSGFEQADWRIEVKRHQWVDGLVLPGFVRATRHLPAELNAHTGAEPGSTDSIRVTLAIHQWELSLD